MDGITEVPLHDATRERYLNYALSVITSRALPDVRDGLKPVQRRILYTMFHELTLHPGGRYKKCASVVGDVMGKYHPHGDQSIYDALVRMAQDFSLRETLVDGQGNFGSLDGDPPAAMRYTECKLTRIAEELLQELKQDTVEVRDTYDGERTEPVVLPAQFPQLLVNGVEGIAVGLSTRIPPHNLGEIIDACVALIDGEATTNADLLKHVQGPDFPTGGRLLADRPALLELYETGQGSLKLRGTWREERDGRKQQVIIDAIPYGQNKSKLVERIGGDVAARKLPQVVDVRDESTDEVRIVLDLKQGANAEAVMAYLFKRTPLEATVSVFMNALVPTERPDLATPERLDLLGCLQHWLDFRYETIRRRFVYELRKLEERIHILEGFAILFGGLDEAIRLIRASDGRQDAKHKLMEAFPLDEIQTDAILDLRLYKLARLEIAAILDELEEKRAEAAEIRALLASESRMWHRVRTEVLEIRNLYASPRRTIVGDAVTDFEFDESAYVVKEETFLVVTRGGWVKRQSSFTEVDRIRVKDADVLGWLIRTDTASSATFFGSDGCAYTMRVDDVPQTAGYGKPLQSFFSMEDGATIAGVVVHDPATWVDVAEGPPPEGDDPPPPHVVSLTRQGRIQRFALSSHAEPSNKNGRIFARLDKGDEVVAAYPSQGGEHVCIASREGNVLTFPVAEANLLKAAGKGTTGIKLKAGDEVLAFELSTDTRSGPQVSTTNGRTFEVTPSRFTGSRAARGKAVIKRGGLQGWARLPFVYTGERGEGTTDDGPGDDGTEGGEA